MSTPSSIADFLNRLGPVAVAKLDAYPIKTNVERSVTGDMVNSALQDFANLVANLLSQKQGVLTFDNTPAAGSSNPVTSAGIAAAITNQIASALVGYMTQPQVAAAITAALAPYSTTAQTAQQIAQAIGAALADYSTTAQMQTAIGDAINTALAAYDTHAEVVQEIADAITAALTDYVTGEQMTEAIAAALADYVTTAAMSTALAGKQDKLAAMGSTTKPVYVYADGTLTPCDDYAGGTKVVLNGEDKGGKSISIYAPTGKGNAEQYYGSKAPDAPGWVTPDNAPTEGSGKLVKSGGIFTAIANAVTGAINTVKTWAEGLFAKIDGYYQTLTAGAAENLVGRGTTPAVISFRPAGGTQDIGTGAASIAKIKGRTDAWNQGVRNAQFDAVGNWNSTNATFSVSGGKGTFTANAQNGGIYQNNVLPKEAGRKVFVAVTLKTTAAVNEIDVYMYGGHVILRNVAASGYQTISGYITTNASWGADLNNNHIIIRDRRTAGWDAVEVASVVAIDLTLEYTAGREPATAAAFLAEYPEALTAPYNADKLVQNKVTAVVTDGFNQWNERWFNGAINEQGQAYSSASNIAAYNFMPCLPSMNYAYDSHKIVALFWYDANRNFIYRSSNVDTGIKVVASPTNAAYFRFYCRSTYGTTYKNDIAINLSHSGIRDGEYEPYWQSTLNIDHSKIYGKLNGAGEMVQIFPDGGRSAGSVYDSVDLVSKTADIKLGSVNLGLLDWNYNSAYGFSAALLGWMKGAADNATANIICPKFTTGTRNGMTTSSGTIALTYAAICCSSSGTDPAAFKTSMNGVQLIAERATPLHYTDLMYSEDGGQTFIELPSNYRVDDFGTERRLPDGIVDGAPASTPLVADIQYAMNAVDTLRRLPTNYLSKESTENLLAALQSAGVIAGYTMTYDEDNAEYDFTIIAPAGA